MTDQNDKVKRLSKRMPWRKQNVAEWRSSTLGMSPSQKGFLNEFLVAQWDVQDQLPLDLQRLSMTLGFSVRTIRALLPNLLELGRITETATGYYNTSLMQEITGHTESLPIDGEFKPNSKPTQLQLEANSAPTRRQLDANSTPKLKKDQRLLRASLELESEEELRQQDAQAREGAVKVLVAESKKEEPQVEELYYDLDQPQIPGEMIPRTRQVKFLPVVVVVDRSKVGAAISKAAGSAMKFNTAAIHDLTPIMDCIERGADLELDVLPVIRDLAGKKEDGTISTWRFFASAIDKAWDIRTREFRQHEISSRRGNMARMKDLLQYPNDKYYAERMAEVGAPGGLIERLGGRDAILAS